MGFLGGGGGGTTIVQQPAAATTTTTTSTAANTQAAADKVSAKTKKQLKQDYGASLTQNLPKYVQSVTSGADTTLSSGSLLGLS